MGSLAIALAVVVLWLERGELLCSTAEAAKSPGGDAAAGCILEFWISRYQTIIAAFLALGAAGLALIPAWRQMKSSERQLALTLGDGPPEFWIDSQLRLWTDPDGGLETAILRCVNRNRRVMRLRRICIREPRQGPWWAVFGGRHLTQRDDQPGRRRQPDRAECVVRG